MKAADGASRTRRRWLLSLLGVALLLLAGARAGLPWVVEVALEQLTGGLLEGRLDIGDVDLDLLEGELVAWNVTLFAHEDEVELAGAGRIAVDFDWGALLRGELEAESFSSREPRLLLAFDAEGRLNWAQIVREDDEEEAAFRVKLARADLGTGSVELKDEAADGLPSLRLLLGALSLDSVVIERPEPGAPLRWGLVGADASEWSLGIAPDSERSFDFAMSASAGPVEPDGDIPFRLGIRREDGVELDVEGQVQPAPLVATLGVRWQGLQSRAIAPLLGLAGVVIERGRSRGELAATLDLSAAPGRGLRATGKVRHVDLELDVPGETRLHLSIPRVEAVLRELLLPIPATPPEVPEPLRLHWARVAVHEPLIDVTLPPEPEPEPQTAEDTAPPEPLQEAASPEPPDDEAPMEPAPAAVLVDTLSIDAGRLVVRDPYGVAPAETAASIELEARDVRIPEVTFEQSRLRLRGRESGTILVEGALGGETGDVRLRATRIDLVAWNPAIEEYSDYSVERGGLSMESRLVLKGRRYQAPTVLTFHRLRAKSKGRAFQRSFGMPLSVALRLLADPAGNIRIRVPVEGDVDTGGRLDLQATFLDALREAIRNTLTNALAAPVDLTGTIFRRIGEFFVLGIGEAAFAPGSSDLPLDARVVLDSAAELVRRTRGARLLIRSEIVEDDLQVLGVSTARDGFFDGVARVGRTILGSGKKAPEEVRETAEELSRARYDAVIAHLTRSGGLRADQIVERPWDGTIREDIPRVILRLRLRK
ncbi:MAG: DUF748 domain-containing protein [Myxococcota bacterium]|nr:DUF748 domain-containing protein [Myxococcota bacterium]